MPLANKLNQRGAVDRHLDDSRYQREVGQRDPLGAARGGYAHPARPGAFPQMGDGRLTYRRAARGVTRERCRTSKCVLTRYISRRILVTVCMPVTQAQRMSLGALWPGAENASMPRDAASTGQR